MTLKLNKVYLIVMVVVCVSLMVTINKHSGNKRTEVRQQVLAQTTKTIENKDSAPILVKTSIVPPDKEVSETFKAKINEAYGKIPLYFTKNDGQVDAKVEYYEKGSGHATYFTKEGIYLSLTKSKPQEKVEPKEVETNTEPKTYQSENVKLSLVGANEAPEITALNVQEGKVNYFVGNDPEKWKTNISTYGAVLYKEVYKDVDVKFW